MKSSRYVLGILGLATLLTSAPQPAAAATKKASPNAHETNSKKAPYSLVISGGISLGAYEAGVNWAIIRALQAEGSSPSPPDLTTVTGASAGSINALLSAMSWCLESPETESTIENNLFWESWKDIGFDSLLPANASCANDGEDENQSDREGKLPRQQDGILCRKEIYKAAQLVADKMKEKKFRNECRISLGFPVTSEIPKYFSLQGFDVPQSRFTVTMDLVTHDDATASLQKHPLKRKGPNGGDANTNLHLPRSTGTSSNAIDVNEAITSILASSAFPAAFGRVALHHCASAEYLNGISKEINKGMLTILGDNANRCPNQKHPILIRENFVDGGVFDNIPLGLAISMEKGEGIPSTYLFMDPDQRRGGEKLKDVVPYAQTPPTRRLFSLSNQLQFFSGAIDTGRKQVLYETMVERFPMLKPGKIPSGNGTNRSLYITKRYPRITGTMANAFGAFFAEGFRRFDYYAGIYDGIMSMSHQLTNGDDKERLRKVAQLYKTLQLCSDPKADYIFHALLAMEPDTSFPTGAKPNKETNKSQENLMEEAGVLPEGYIRFNEYNLSQVQGTPLHFLMAMLMGERGKPEKDLEDLDFDKFAERFLKEIEEENKAKIGTVSPREQAKRFVTPESPEISPDQVEDATDLLTQALETPEKWFMPLLERITKRARYLEGYSKQLARQNPDDFRFEKLREPAEKPQERKKNEDTEKKTPIASQVGQAVGVLDHLIGVTTDRERWLLPTSAQNNYPSRIFPYSLGTDFHNGGPVLGWKLARIPTHLLPGWVEADFTPIHRYIDAGEHIWTASSTLVWRPECTATALKDSLTEYPCLALSSRYHNFGFGVGADYDWDNKHLASFDERASLGPVVDVRLLNLFKLSYHNRVDYQGQGTTWLFTIEDVSSLADALIQYKPNRFKPYQ